MALRKATIAKEALRQLGGIVEMLRTKWDWSAKPTLQQAREEVERLRAQLAKAEKEIERLAKEPWCPFCKKHHVGGDACLGHFP